MAGMRVLVRSLLICATLAALVPASAKAKCSSKASVARQVAETAKQIGFMQPEFRYTKQADGQALLYWRFGMDSRSFYAVIFRSDGCAVLTKAGQPRRFVFPRSAYNTGVFEEMAAFDAQM